MFVRQDIYLDKSIYEDVVVELPDGKFITCPWHDVSPDLAISRESKIDYLINKSIIINKANDSYGKIIIFRTTRSLNFIALCILYELEMIKGIE